MWFPNAKTGIIAVVIVAFVVANSWLNIQYLSIFLKTYSFLDDE